jgi:hypothetical protein
MHSEALPYRSGATRLRAERWADAKFVLFRDQTGQSQQLFARNAQPVANTIDIVAPSVESTVVSRQIAELLEISQTLHGVAAQIERFI